MRDAKRLYYQSLFQDNKDNGKKTWDLLNEIVNKKRNKHAKLPTMFFDNYGFSYENSHIAEGFNNFFAEVGTNLEKEIPVSCSGAVDYLGNPNYAPLNEELSTTPYEIAKIIKSLNPVGGGIDKISTKIILYTYEKCLPHLTFFFDLCLRTAVFPDHLKIALVVPIYKTGEKDKFNNYRPISLLPVFSKILEKLLHSRLLEYIEFNKILHPFQFGFRRKHSTYMPIAHLINEITESLQDQKIICGIYLDLKKAFDTVSFDILLNKLYVLGIKGDMFTILKSYLYGRYQRTKFNNTISGLVAVKMGVPQGSILGPLLFILYINDLPNVSDEIKFYFFADDTAISVKSSCVTELQTKLNHVMPKVTEWFNANRLSLNASKTHFQIYSRTFINDIDIQLNSCKILRQKYVKYLGVVVEENLKFEKHVSNIASVISRNIGVMGRSKSVLSSRELLLLYNSLVLPYLSYCAAVWGSNYPTRLAKIEKLQKRAIRIIDNKPYFFPTNALFVKYNVLKFRDIVQQQNIMIMLAFLNGNLPDSMSKMFRLHVPVGTRAIKHFHVPFAASNYRAFSLAHSAPSTWNNIIVHLFRNIENVPRNKFTLKKHLRKYLVNKYLT